ncbi:MAG: DUF1579 domain-containing protein [Proteobacteria bacterium]|nr:MAG: DUF1579 domain-containing protein [Pseudomonadota bacterium]
MGSNQGQDQDAGNDFNNKAGGPSQGPSHRLLEAFVGTWKVEGDTHGEGNKDEAYGTEIYRWLDGEFFLEYHWDRTISGKRHTGLGVVGYDDFKQKYMTRNFDNLGFFREYETTIEKGVMTLQGKEERATIGLNAGENNITIDWEFTKDGHTWERLCHLKGHKVH